LTIKQNKNLKKSFRADCVQCGYCCQKRPCAFGEWDAEKNQCKFLTDDMKCSIYDWILKQPGNEINPAFGAGCCSALFNEQREKKIRELNV